MNHEIPHTDPDETPMPEAREGVFWGSVLDVQPEGVVALLQDSQTKEEGVIRLEPGQLPEGVEEILGQGKQFWLDTSTLPDPAAATFDTNTFGFMTPDPLTEEDNFGYRI